MIYDERCLECLLSRVNLETDLIQCSQKRKNAIIAHADQMIRFLLKTPRTHPMVASELHRQMYHLLKNPDPFYALKEVSQNVSLTVLKEISGRLLTFQDCVLASVIGNMFDYGVKDHDIGDDFTSFFNEEFVSGLFVDNTNEILPLCHDMVYFTDNCGEIVFDAHLITWLKTHGSRVTLVVRDKPVLNDATLDEVYALNLDKKVDSLYTTGAGVELGIRFDLLPGEVMDAIDRCSLIISKGMANYESLREEEGLPPVAYLLAAKCDVIAEELGVPKRSKIALLRRSY